MNEKGQKTKKGMSMKGQRTLAYIVLIIISFFCLFWFYVLFINATRSNGALKKGFTSIPGGFLIKNWKSLLAGTLPVLIAQLRSADFLNFDMGQVYVMIAFSIFPVIIVYILLSKFIVEGVSAGAVKG